MSAVRHDPTPPWGDQLPTDIPPDGPTAAQIRFAKWVIWRIPGKCPLDNLFGIDDPRIWDDLKLYLRRAASEAEKRREESPTAYPHRPTLYPHEQVGGGSGVMDSDAIFEAARDESGLMLTEPAREVLRVVFGAIDATDEMWQPMVGPTTREYAHTIVAHLDQLLGNTSSP